MVTFLVFFVALPVVLLVVVLLAESAPKSGHRPMIVPRSAPNRDALSARHHSLVFALEEDDYGIMNPTNPAYRGPRSS